MIGGISCLILLAVAILLAVPRGPAADRLDLSALPRLNAALNASSALLLLAGYSFVRRRRIRLHRLCMLSAFGLSALFLLSYLVYHAVAGATRFVGPHALRPIYLAVLFSHMILAALSVPLALTTLYRAWRSKFLEHRRLARWTLPIWLYVSISGVLVYLMLYHF